MTDGTPITDAERARLEQRRERLRKLLKAGDGSGDEVLDPDDRADLMQEWTKLDNLLNRR